MGQRRAERVAVVGGGFLGMEIARELAEAGREVTLFDASDSLGGLAGTWRLGEHVWDKHYHVTLLSDLATRRLLGRLGLESEVEWVETRTGFFTDGALYSMSNTLEFLRFPPLDLVSKLRLGATIAYASRLTDWRALEQERVADWLTRLSGRKTFERIWRPLLMSKLGQAYRKTSAAFIWATIARMYAARRTGLKKEMFGYVRGGYATTIDRFGTHLRDTGVTLRLGARVQSITRRADGRHAVTVAGKRARLFDKVVVTAAAPVAARLCDDLTDFETRRLNDVAYQGIVCSSMLLPYALSPYYVTNITDEWVPFTGVIEMTALVDRAELGGHHLVYLPKYVDPDDPLMTEDDAAIRERFVSALERMYPHFNREDIAAFETSRVRFVFPIPTLRYSERVPPMATSVAGLYVVNSAQILNGTLNVNETLLLAERAVNTILERSP